MAEFTPSKKTLQDFNNGIKYVDGQGNDTGDVVHAETINSLIESQLWTQQQAENSVTTANLANTKSDNAVSAANSANSKSDNAVSAANSANSKADSAVTTATAASTNANNALNIANKVKSLGENQPNITDANNVGTANVSIEDIGNSELRFKFSNIKGAKGNTGDTGNGISSTAITYATGTLGTTPPTSGWQSSIPSVAKGNYLWTRTVFTYTDGTTNTSYTSAYQGKDGTGSVTGVKGNAESTYRAGNVNLTPENVGAVSKSGDTMTGPLKVPALLASSASNIGQVVPFSMAFYTSPGGDPAKAVDEILKRIKATYPIDRNETTFFGMVQNSWIGTYMANVYMNEEDSSQALPQYSSGILIIRGEPGQNSSHQAYLIGTENYIGRCIPLAHLDYVYSPSNPPPTDKLAAYPVGSIYISNKTTSPASLFGGNWQQLLGERYLQTAINANFLGNYLDAGLPNITGDFGDSQLFISGGSTSGTIGNGALRTEASQGGLGVGKYFVNNKITFNASRSNPIYGKSDTVRPKSYCVYMWCRIA